MLFKFENETDWMKARDPNVNTTDLAALFGLSQYKSRLRLWHEKAGLVQSDFVETDLTKWGRRLQTAVGLGICEDNGWEGFDLTGYYYSDPETRTGSSMDIRVNCPKRGPGILEVKVAESFDEDNGWTKNSAPIDYEFQLHGQLRLARKNGEDIRWGAIGALGRRQKTKLYIRDYDYELATMIDDEAKSFWQSITDNKPPRPDYAVDGALLEAIRKSIRSGDICNLSQNNRAVSLMADYFSREKELVEAKRTVEEIELDRMKIKNEIWDIMGRNEIANIGEYQVKARVQQVEERVQLGYSFRRFDISKRRK